MLPASNCIALSKLIQKYGSTYKAALFLKEQGFPLSIARNVLTR